MENVRHYYARRSVERPGSLSVIPSDICWYTLDKASFFKHRNFNTPAGSRQRGKEMPHASLQRYNDKRHEGDAVRAVEMKWLTKNAITIKVRKNPNNSVENHNVDIGTHMSQRSNMRHTSVKFAYIYIYTYTQLR